MSNQSYLFSFEKLKIWQRSMALWERLQCVTSTFPSDERFGLTSQIRRAACSVPSNIAEGYGKGTDSAFAAMVRHSRRSLFELYTQIEGARRFGYITETVAKEIMAEVAEISKMIDAFIRGMSKHGVREEEALYAIAKMDSDEPVYGLRTKD